jgi:hypothetical protein
MPTPLPRFWLSFVLLAGIVAASPQSEGNHPFDTRSNLHFGDATVPLREFLRDRHVRTSKTQHFCIVGYQDRDGEQAWVHWTEGEQIILWRGANNPRGAKSSIARSRRVIDLRKDVVPAEADIKGSTYLVTRAWVDRILTACQASGNKYEISINEK